MPSSQSAIALHVAQSSPGLQKPEARSLVCIFTANVVIMMYCDKATESVETINRKVTARNQYNAVYNHFNN